jgi:nucleoid-associated protein YgaU
MADATAALRTFAVKCAERALTRERERGREPDPRSWEAVRIARLAIDDRSPTILDQLARARFAAADAADAAYAAYAAADAAYAADAAAADAAADAAYAAADAADTARGEEISWQERRFGELMDALFAEVRA